MNSEKSEKFSRICVEGLKSARTALGISQYELAKQSGVSRTMIHHLENGKRNPTLITLHALADALELDLAKLVENAQEMSKAEVRKSQIDAPA